MNSLFKLQALMIGFLLLVLAAFLMELLLLVPALVLFALQFPVAKGELKGDYPEDWKKYTAVFIGYETILILLAAWIWFTGISYMDMGSIVNVLFAVLFVIILTLVLKYFLMRRYCYGDVLFTTKGWAGVAIKSDLFSKISGANYAVENPRNVKAGKGDRVKVRVESSLGKTVPSELVEAIRR